MPWIYIPDLKPSEVKPDDKLYQLDFRKTWFDKQEDGSINFEYSFRDEVSGRRQRKEDVIVFKVKNNKITGTGGAHKSRLDTSYL
ncbi:hypothetical protein NIES4071_105880 (plasmid) [Calothrix sp. NIES-4071]|nr:hypothetical protein NIES4071_105880 [Calothrix sp. NIES-4071]BAZ65006.1 hypothetical protein NIES4105_107390 [Calothrix sp. NIES-4105]